MINEIITHKEEDTFLDYTKGIFKVGGCVRDELLGTPADDIDFVVVGSSHKEMIDNGFIHIGGQKGLPVYKGRSPVLGGDEMHDHALARIEVSNGGGHNDFQTITKNITLTEDLRRRDLTINAIACIDGKTYFDPFKGIKDIRNKVLRHTSKHFVEDPVRVLRLARFAAKYPDFTIASQTKHLVSQMRENLYELTPSRVLKELVKALKLEKPSLFFRALRELDVLDLVFPELHRMIPCQQNPEYHYEGNLFEHTMLVVDCAKGLSNKTEVVMAALYHDIAKPASLEKYDNYHHHNDGKLVSEEVAQLRERYAITNEMRDIITAGAKYHYILHTLHLMSAKKVLTKVSEKDFPKKMNGIENLFTISMADAHGRYIVTDEGLIVDGEHCGRYKNRDKVHALKKIQKFVSGYKSGNFIQAFKNKFKREPTIKEIKAAQERAKISFIQKVLEDLNY